MRVETVWYCLLPIACFAGCTIMSPAPRMAINEPGTPPVQQFSERLDHNGNRLPPDFSRFRPGGYCMLKTIPEGSSSDESTARDNVPPAEDCNSYQAIAGRIVSMDDTHVVLADAISISTDPGHRTMESAPASAIPLTSTLMLYAMYGPLAPSMSKRMFKVSGIGRRTTVIPGEVMVDRKSIVDLQPVDGTDWDQVQHSGRWFERVGIDIE